MHLEPEDVARHLDAVSRLEPLVLPMVAHPASLHYSFRCCRGR